MELHPNPLISQIYCHSVWYVIDPKFTLYNSMETIRIEFTLEQTLLGKSTTNQGEPTQLMRY